jgi:cytidine deaminase
MTNDELIEKAQATANSKVIGDGCKVGDVGCALLTDKGNLYLGVCIDASSGIGFCAEHSAIAAMVTAGEHHIRKIVAARWDGRVLPPCGRCREFMRLIDDGNMEHTEVIIAKDKAVKLQELLPYPYVGTKKRADSAGRAL